LMYIEKSKLSPKPLAVPPPILPAAAPTPLLPQRSLTFGENYVDIPLTNMRSTIAKRLSTSKVSIGILKAFIYCSLELSATRVRLECNSCRQCDANA
jgi:pyruvate/2-oxoglutarate dehydrogenase complex dihydrolipoamide acyltransferase (E2) component